MEEYASSLSSWVEINLEAIRKNVRWVKETTSVQVMAVVKADAYGHGAIPVSRAAIEAGASWLGVARVEEALELRAGGFFRPILILGYAPPRQVYLALQHDLSLTVWREDQIEFIQETAAERNQTARLHLKIDSGMGRIGAQPEEITTLARKIHQSRHLYLEGVFTHFACADKSNPQTTDRQMEIFHHSLEKISPYLRSDTLIHASNSAALIARKDSLFNLVRLGIAMYGLQPSEEWTLPPAFLPALSWKTVLTHVKTLPAGRGISYGHRYITQKSERIGTIPVGYADGFRRCDGNVVLVRGTIAPVVGRVCMDQCMVQLDGVPQASCGDEVVLIGVQEGQHIRAEDVAKTWGTINYEVVCGIGKRVPRIYLNFESSFQQPQDNR